MSQHEFDAVLQKYLQGTCNAREEKIVLDWYETFISESEIHLSPIEKQLLEKKIWASIHLGKDGAQYPLSGKTVPFSRKWLNVAAAACLIVAMGSGYWYYQHSVKQVIPAFAMIKIPEGYSVLYNRNEEVQSVVLSDGSQVELQPQSSLYYPKAFTGTSRSVYLTGNAFFKIAHDASRHFMVHTDEGLLAEVLGTSFYVLHEDLTNKVVVSVVTGKVSVYEENRKKSEDGMVKDKRIILTPNQKVSYKPAYSQFVTSLVEEPRLIEPVAGGQPELKFVFDEAPLSDVLKQLAASYGIDIKIENPSLNNCHFTGDITKQNLYDKLNIICQSLQSSYEIRGTVIYLKGNGCK